MAFKKHIIVALIVSPLLLAGCDNAGKKTNDVVKLPVIEEPVKVIDPELVRIASEYTYSFTGADALAEAFTLPPTLIITKVGDAVQLAGTIEPKSSSGKTTAAYLTLGNAAERDLQSSAVEIMVLAKGKTATSTPDMAVAYSTNDQGNSGWKTFELSGNRMAYTFVYNVPKFVVGKNDYIGIGPLSSNPADDIEIHAVGIRKVQ